MRHLLYIFRWVVVLSITIFVGFFGGAGAMKIILSVTSDKPQTTQPPKVVLKVAITEMPKANSQELEKIIQNELLGTKGQYGIVFENLQTQEVYQAKENRRYESASLYKLWVMATVFEQIEGGELEMEDRLQQDIAVLNNKFKIATESAERTDGSINLTVEDALERMITISDNYSALLLSEKVRLSNVTTFLKNHGFVDSKVGSGGNSPSTTPQETAMFLKMLYSQELANDENTGKMLGLLKKQKLNAKIPKYLPAGTVIAHKTGELGEFSHDAGIVYTPKGNYMLVVLSESNSRAGADGRIADISSAIYKYVTQE